MVADREAAARAIAEAAKRTRTPLPTWLWVVGLVMGGICLGALALGWLFADPTPHAATSEPRPILSSSNGFTIGLVIGLGCGIAIGILMAVRIRKRD